MLMTGDTLCLIATALMAISSVKMDDIIKTDGENNFEFAWLIGFLGLINTF